MNCSNTHKNIHLTYSSEEIVKNFKIVELNSLTPICEKSFNSVEQTFATLFHNNLEVGKIFYYSNVISTNMIKYQLFENVAIKLYSSPCFEENTFAIGNLFYEDNNYMLFNENKELNFKSISTGGSFENKNVCVNIKTNDTPIRHLEIKIHDM